MLNYWLARVRNNGRPKFCCRIVTEQYAAAAAAAAAIAAVAVAH